MVRKDRKMKGLDASPDSSCDVWASVCPLPKEGKSHKRKQIYSKEFQEMLDKLDTEEEEEELEVVGLRDVGGGEKKRRLSIDQVKALEMSFEKENKLEPERKNRLAEDLGLQPRQVAIWFQNRRARWKTKQLEREYSVLKSDYDSLRADYDSLEQENKSLLSQLTELKMKLQQRVRAAENNLDCKCQVVTGEERPVSELAIVNPQFSYGSDSDDSLIKESEEDDDRNLLKADADTVMPMCSPTLVSSLNHNCTSTASPGSLCTTAVSSWFQGWDPRAGKASYANPQHGMMMRMATAEEQQQLGWLNFFSVDQAPTLHCYFKTDDDK